MGNNNGFIFISHRSSDKNIVDLFVDFLKVLGIPSNTIFCSSLPGNDVIYKIDDEIKEALSNSKLNILFLSSNYYQSVYCLNEEGIIWYQDTPSIIIKLPRVDESNIIGFIDNSYKLRDLSVQSDIESIYDIIKSLFNINNKIAVINSEITKFINRYNEIICTQKQSTEITKEVSKYKLTDDEAVVLFYLHYKEARKATIEELNNWLYNGELYGFDVRNGMDLIAASNQAIFNDKAIELNIDCFRGLMGIPNEELERLEDIINSHYKSSRVAFLKLWESNSFSEKILLFISYIIDEKEDSFGDRWLADAQISSIKHWENSNMLDSTLSNNYGKCLDFFKENNFVFPSSFTSYGNPREYKLNSSLRDLLLSNNFPYSEKLSTIKNKHIYDTPF